MGLAFSADNQREHFRFKSSLRGCIQYLGASYPCLVEDVSEKGFLLVCGAAVEVGSELTLELRMSDGMRFTCMIEVRHVNSDGLGGQIVGISEQDAKLLAQVIGAHYSYLKSEYTRGG